MTSPPLACHRETHISKNYDEYNDYNKWAELLLTLVHEEYHETHTELNVASWGEGSGAYAQEFSFAHDLYEYAVANGCNPEFIQDIVDDANQDRLNNHYPKWQTSTCTCGAGA